MENNIVVICDLQEYDIEHVLQLLTKARNLGNQYKCKVSVLCVGYWKDIEYESFFRYGADKIVICRQEDQFDISYFTDVLIEMIKKIIPKVILIPDSSNGRRTAAILSTRFEAGLIEDCVDIDFDKGGELYFSKVAFNSSDVTKIKRFNCNIMLGTVKKDIFIEKVCDTQAKGMIEEFTYYGEKEKLSSSWEVLEWQKKLEKKDIDIHKYKKVFCVGRGVKNKETFDRIFNIAEKFGAGVVGTRAVVEAGFIEKERMIGQSGKSLSSPIYIGFGVSGASQHMIGIKNAELIVAVNKDKNAAIFDYADYSIVDNIEAVLDELEKIAEK